MCSWRCQYRKKNVSVVLCLWFEKRGCDSNCTIVRCDSSALPKEGMLFYESLWQDRAGWPVPSISGTLYRRRLGVLAAVWSDLSWIVILFPKQVLIKWSFTRSRKRHRLFVFYHMALAGSVTPPSFICWITALLTARCVSSAFLALPRGVCGELFNVAQR